jgi:peptidoglycan/xylan/chitin deacetylase (PgdA/CDA1 family)
MYHRVLPDNRQYESFSHEGIIVSDKTFDMQMQFLNKQFNVLSISDFEKQLSGKTDASRASCLITFDDGWIDNHMYAYPILTKHKTPALIFLATKFIGSSDKFWQEELSSLLYFLYKNKEELALREHKLDYIIDLKSKHALTEINKYINSKLKSGPADIPKRMISEILDSLSENNKLSLLARNIDGFMNWDQIIEMMNNNIDFGAHTVNHKILTSLENNEIEHEIKTSKNVIESITNRKVKYFAYPNGNFNNYISDMVKTCGFTLAFTTKHGAISAGDNPYQLKRLNIHNDNTKNIPMFYCYILGIL